MKKQIKNFKSKRDTGIFSRVLFTLYKINKPSVRKFIIRYLWHYLGRANQFYSTTLRKIFKEYHDIDVGMYSHGDCFAFGALSPGVKIGRYCSIAVGVVRYDHNHPINTKSSHAFFFNPSLGYVSEDGAEKVKLVIGNDVWIGHGAIILAGCRNIGHGAVIGAGSVVNKDIPPYCIAIGNPARIVMKRFSDEKIEELLKEQWWDKDIDELIPDMNDYTREYESQQ